MLIKHTYPVTGDIFMPEHWPIVWENYRVTWKVTDKKVEAVTITVRTSDISSLPNIGKSPSPGIAANIDMGFDPTRDQVESILRTACGLLGFFAQADIDFDRPTTEWEPENDEERSRLQMFSFTSGPSERKPPLPLSYDIVARCFLAAIPASDKEIPLSFIARARRAMSQGSYIDAFYSYYFFFETQFAAGYSKPREVAKRFKQSSEIMGAFADARTMALEELSRVRGMKSLIAKTDTEIIDHLVDTRGMLHHHAPRRKKGAWHPEKHDQFEAEALILSYLTYAVAQRHNIPIMYDDKISQMMLDGAKAEGAIYTYKVEFEGGSDRYGLNGLSNLNMNFTCCAPSHKGLASLNEKLREEGAPYDLAAVRSYSVKSADGNETFAIYKNNTFPPGGKNCS
jgi:hypothetical protein